MTIVEKYINSLKIKAMFCKCKYQKGSKELQVEIKGLGSAVHLLFWYVCLREPPSERGPQLGPNRSTAQPGGTPRSALHPFSAEIRSFSAIPISLFETIFLLQFNWLNCLNSCQSNHEGTLNNLSFNCLIKKVKCF